MTNLIPYLYETGLTGFGLICAGAIIVTMAAHMLMLQRRLRALEAGSLSASVTLADRDMVIECLRLTVMDQAHRIADAEDRAALLERAQKKNLRASIMAMPVIDRPKVLGRAGQISMN